MNYISSRKSFLLCALSFFAITSAYIVNASESNLDVEKVATEALERKFNCNPSNGCTPPVSSCGSTTTITSVPYIICKPGLYCVNANQDLTDSTLPCPVHITIQSDNVYLSLNGFTLTGGTRGVDIKECSQNVVVTGGVIKNTEAEAIRVGKNSSNIVISNISVINCNIGNTCDGVAAILFNGTFADSIKDSIVSRSSVVSSFGTGVSMRFCQDCRVFNTNVFGISNGFNSDANGFYSSGNGTYYEGCKAGNIVSSNPLYSAHGFFAEGSNNNFYHGCEAALISATGVGLIEATGFTVANSQNVIVELCSTSSVSGTNAYGYESRNSIATAFEKCAAYKDSIGFFLNSDNASGIFFSSAVSGATSGYSLLNCTNCIVGMNKSLGNNVGFTEVPVVGSTSRFFSNFSADSSAPANNYVSANIVQVGLHCQPLLGANVNGDTPC